MTPGSQVAQDFKARTFELRFNANGYLIGVIPWNVLEDGKTRLILVFNKPGYDKTIRNSASSFSKKSKWKISVQKITDGKVMAWRSEGLKGVSPFAFLKDMKVGEERIYHWPIKGDGDYPPGFHALRRMIYDLEKKEGKVFWKYPTYESVAIQRKK